MNVDHRSCAALGVLVLVSFCTGCGKESAPPPPIPAASTGAVEPAVASVVGPEERWKALVQPVSELAGVPGDGELRTRLLARHKKLSTFSADAVAPVVEPGADVEKATISAGLAQLAGIATWRTAHAAQTLAAAKVENVEIQALLSMMSMEKNVRLASAMETRKRLGVERALIDKGGELIRACKDNAAADAVDYQLALHLTLSAFYVSEATYTRHAEVYGKVVESVEGLLESGATSFIPPTLKLIANLARDFSDVGMQPLTGRLIAALEGKGKGRPPGGAAAAGLGTTLEDQDRVTREAIRVKEMDIVTRAAKLAPLERTATDPERAKLYTEFYSANLQVLEDNLTRAATMSAKMPEQTRSFYTGYSASTAQRKEIMKRILVACAKGDLAAVDQLQLELGKVRW